MGSWLLLRVEGWGVPEIGQEGWLRRFAHSLGGGVLAHAQCFAPGSSEVQVVVVVLFFFLYLMSRIYPNCTVIFSPI